MEQPGATQPTNLSVVIAKALEEYAKLPRVPGPTQAQYVANAVKEALEKWADTPKQ